METTWVKVQDQLPKEDGRYLVVCAYRGDINCRDIAIWRFATNLSTVNEHDFPAEKYSRSGWYSLDDETGYFERSGVLYWAKLPPMPKEEET